KNNSGRKAEIFATSSEMILNKKQLDSFNFASNSTHNTILRFSFYGPFDNYLIGLTILRPKIYFNKTMHDELYQDIIGITLTFDRWTNIKNKQLFGVIIIFSKEKPYVWHATDISSERETHVKVIEKTRFMINELKKIKIKVLAVVTNSAGPYAVA
ncbi:1795_t:CDS:2, partial [Cetraspora pellucida]